MQKVKKTFFGQEKNCLRTLRMIYDTQNLALHINTREKSKSCLLVTSTCVSTHTHTQTLSHTHARKGV